MTDDDGHEWEHDWDWKEVQAYMLVQGLMETKADQDDVLGGKAKVRMTAKGKDVARVLSAFGVLNLIAGLKEEGDDGDND